MISWSLRDCLPHVPDFQRCLLQGWVTLQCSGSQRSFLMSRMTSAAVSFAEPLLRCIERSQMEQSSCPPLQVDNETDGMSSPCQCCQDGVYQSEFMQYAQKKGAIDLPGLLWGGHGLSLLLEAQGDCLPDSVASG